VLLDGNIYIGGGSEESLRITLDYQNCYRLDVYNLITNQWSSPIITPHSWFAMTVVDGKLVTAGGMTENHEIVNDILSLNTGEWEVYSEMPTARYQATAVGYQEMLIVIGGANQIECKITDLSTIELLDTTSGCWYTCNDLPSPHSQLKAAVIDDKLYLLGGFSNDELSSQVIFASLDTLSTYKLNWQSLPDSPWHYSTAAVLHNKFLLTIGGRRPSVLTSQTCEVCAFNPSTGLWEHITNIPEARSLPGVVGMDDKIIVIGGTNVNRKYSKSVWIGTFK